jgi:hypothetical protein
VHVYLNNFRRRKNLEESKKFIRDFTVNRRRIKRAMGGGGVVVVEWSGVRGSRETKTLCIEECKKESFGGTIRKNSKSCLQAPRAPEKAVCHFSAE